MCPLYLKGSPRFLLNGVWRDGDNVVAPHFHTSPALHSDDLELTVVRRVIPDDVKRAIGFEPLPHGRDLKGERGRWQ